MFVTMSCLSESSDFSPCKEINDAAATSSLMLTTYWESLYFEIMTHNYHQSLAIILFGELLEINPISISATFVDYNNQEWFLISSYPQKWNIHSPTKIGKGLTRWALVPLGPTLIYTTEEMNCCLWLLWINNVECPLFPSSYMSGTNANNNQQEELSMIDLNIFNLLGKFHI